MEIVPIGWVGVAVRTDGPRLKVTSARRMNQREPNNFDLVADLYDSYVNADFDMAFWIAEAMKAGEVLELMAGTGRVSVPLAKAGVRITCVDAMPAMLDRLRAKLQTAGLKAEVVTQDVRDLAVGRTFPLVIIPFNSFSEIVDREDRAVALRRIHKHLAPGGRLIVTLRNLQPAWREADGHVRLIGTYVGPKDGSRLVVSVGLLPSETPEVVDAKQFYELYDHEGRLITKRMFELSFALVSPTELEGQATAAGFSVEARYGDYDRNTFDPELSPYFICILTRS